MKTHKRDEKGRMFFFSFLIVRLEYNGRESKANFLYIKWGGYAVGSQNLEVCSSIEQQCKTKRWQYENADFAFKFPRY